MYQRTSTNSILLSSSEYKEAISAGYLITAGEYISLPEYSFSEAGGTLVRGEGVGVGVGVGGPNTYSAIKRMKKLNGCTVSVKHCK